MKKSAFLYFRRIVVALFGLALLFSCQNTNTELQWRKGNMHTHTFWSDGDDFPEAVAKWYKDHGYDFLVHTDHNTLLEGERWRTFPEDHPALEEYVKAFGEEWVETRPADKDAHVQVRLKPLDAFRGQFEEPGEFLLIGGNEITAHHGVHMVGYHHHEVIPPADGSADDRVQMIEETLERVAEYRAKTGRNTHPVLAHPNFTWAITAEMMLQAEDLRFFEVYNGHPAVHNMGNEYRASTERIWDIVLSKRLASGEGKVLYGLATDDAHNYHADGANPGRGWVMVQTADLSPGSLLDAIDRGDFYASTGVTLKEIHFDGETLQVKIDAEEGVDYTTEYIGTRKGIDTSSVPGVDEEGNKIPHTTRSYSDEIGKVLATSNDLRSSYTFAGDELYVRVRITSSADKKDRITGKLIGRKKAWVQPVVPGITKAYTR